MWQFCKTADLLSSAGLRKCIWMISNAEVPPKNLTPPCSSTACIVWSRASPGVLLPTPPHHVPVPEYTMYLHSFASVKEKMWNGFLVQFWHRETTIGPRNHAMFCKPPCKYLLYYFMVERLKHSVQTANDPDSHWCLVWKATPKSRPFASYYSSKKHVSMCEIHLGNNTQIKQPHKKGGVPRLITFSSSRPWRTDRQQQGEVGFQNWGGSSGNNPSAQLVLLLIIYEGGNWETSLIKMGRISDTFEGKDIRPSAVADTQLTDYLANQEQA